jgi:hypothetical protein
MWHWIKTTFDTLVSFQYLEGIKGIIGFFSEPLGLTVLATVIFAIAYFFFFPRK